ncbi:MAG: hypothetical protein JOZ25_08870 [Actinobacteria bacterium]|nr:hypothetical protein [Actinomycetota bacterium]
MLVALAVRGSGGGGERSGHAASGQAQARRAGYRWLVGTSGPPPTIAQENRFAGTRAWQLAGGEGHGDVEGYVASQSIRPGETERVYVHAKAARWIRVDVYRMGWYGGLEGRLVLASRRLPPQAQPPCTHDVATGLTECRWHTTLGFQIPSALPSGVYLVKMTIDTGAARDAMFVVESARPQPVLAQISTATYEAYNTWGGDSLYPGGQRVTATGTGQGVEVSYDRPYETVTGAGQFLTRDVAIVRFLEREGYDVSYTTNESVDDQPGQVTGHRVLLDIGHSEYWSQRAADAFRGARDHGTNLVFLASNTLSWRVRFAPATRASSEARRPGHRIVGYKEHVALDPDRRLPTGHFPSGAGPLAGTNWQECVTPRIPAVGRSINHYYPWRPATSLSPAWLFQGTGFTASSTVPGIVGYEPDRTDAHSPAGIQIVGNGDAQCQGRGSGVSQSTLYRAPSGALVFSSGTMGWQLGLSPVPDASPDAPRQSDPRLVRLTENLFARLLGR